MDGRWYRARIRGYTGSIPPAREGKRPAARKTVESLTAARRQVHTLQVEIFTFENTVINLLNVSEASGLIGPAAASVS